MAPALQKSREGLSLVWISMPVWDDANPFHRCNTM